MSLFNTLNVGQLTFSLFNWKKFSLKNPKTILKVDAILTVYRICFVTSSPNLKLCVVITLCIELCWTLKKLYLLHTYFCCHSETLKNTSMPISKLFLYVAGVIFIFSRVELSGYIIFQVCCRELTLLQLAEASHFVWLRVERTAQ